MTTQIKFIFILFTICIFSNAQSIKLTTIENKTDRDYTITKDIAYGNDPEQGMDIYIAKDAKQLGNKNFTVIFLHGGGYYLSDKSREERYIKPYLQKGMNVINMNYRIKRGIPIATEDLTNALNFLTTNTHTYSLNLKNIILTGFSAGAQIASSVGLSQNNADYPFPLKNKVAINGIINFSGPTDHLPIVEHIFKNSNVKILKKLGEAFFPPNPNFTREEAIKTFQPITYFDTNDPPFFLWHGGLDDQVPVSTTVDFVPLLKKDPKNKVVFDAEAGHSPNKIQFDYAYQEIFKFLDELN